MFSSSLEPPSTNCFGALLPSIRDIANEPEMVSVLDTTLELILFRIFSDQKIVAELKTEILLAAAEHKDEAEYEERANGLLQHYGALKVFPVLLKSRSEIIFEQIRPLVSGQKILDLGCGDGNVGGRLLKSGFRVTGCDVYRHKNIDRVDLPFVKVVGPILPLEAESFDCVLCLTVLHHAQDPKPLLAEAVRVLKPGGKFIVIESVYGIDRLPNSLPATPENLRFTSMNSETQRLSNMFFDHFYNRIIHFSPVLSEKVPVPFNFNTPENWQTCFKSAGLDTVSLTHLGVDQPIVAEYHTLHLEQKRV